MKIDGAGSLTGPGVRVALFGFGQLGRRMAAILARRTGVEVVAIISRSMAGQPARSVIPDLPASLVVTANPERAFAEARPHVVLHATAPLLSEVLDQLMLTIRAGSHVISSCEELAYPWAVHQEAAEVLDQEARRHGVAVLGTGVNPGFVFDALVLEALSSRWNPKAIAVSRVTDASSFGPAVRRRLGLGLQPSEFEAMVAAGDVAGHVGFRESMDLIAAALGTRIETFEESMEPLIADRDGYGVRTGQTAGFVQKAKGHCAGGLYLDFQLSLHLWPRGVGLEVIDSIKVQDLDAVHEIQVRPASLPLEAAAAQLVNAIPHILVAEPGLRTRLDMRGPAPWLAFPQNVGWRHTRR
jgi:4-hydroxy-tetrahydrodipicolinate reductase